MQYGDVTAKILQIKDIINLSLSLSEDIQQGTYRKLGILLSNVSSTVTSPLRGA